jgi:hypothetical protein
VKASTCAIALISTLGTVALAGSPPPQNKLPGGIRVPSVTKHAVDRVLPVDQAADDLNPEYRENTAPATTGAAATALPMTFHGGKVLAATTQVRLIFAGPNWANATFAGTKISGLAKFFGSYSNSPYAKTASEYTGSNGKVSAVIGYQGYTAPSTKSVSLDGRNINSVVTAACTEYRSGAFKADTAGNQYIIAYTDMARPSTVGYCGYHTAASCSGQIVQVAFLWNLDGDAGCSAQDTTTGNSQGLAALANVTAHEVQETISDPLLNAWYDASNAENGDKCAWSYGHTSILFGTSKFKVQSEWSNAAYTAGKGYKNLSGQAGCLDGY